MAAAAVLIGGVAGGGAGCAGFVAGSVGAVSVEVSLAASTSVSSTSAKLGSLESLTGDAEFEDAGLGALAGSGRAAGWAKGRVSTDAMRSAVPREQRLAPTTGAKLR